MKTDAKEAKAHGGHASEGTGGEERRSKRGDEEKDAAVAGFIRRCSFRR
jgi:hypothetical protein